MDRQQNALFEAENEDIRPETAYCWGINARNSRVYLGPTPGLRMTTARANHTATLLPDGKVLIAGGWDFTGTHSTAELYDSATGTFTETGSMITVRGDHTATLLPDGRVLIAGGLGSDGSALSSAELYDPVSGEFIPID